MVQIIRKKDKDGIVYKDKIQTSEERERYESAVRRDVKGIAKTDIQCRAKLSCNLFDKKGEMLRNEQGLPFVLETTGFALLIRLHKVTFDHSKSAPVWDKEKDGFVPNKSASEKMEEANNKRFVDAVGLAKHLAGGRGDASILAKIDDSDNLIVIGSPLSVEKLLDHLLERGWLESWEGLKKLRVPVIGTGSAPNQACQRSAYKDMVREQKMGKANRDDARRASVTMDEVDLADLCKCVRCGHSVKQHDDVSCPAPVFVPDTEAIAEAQEAKAQDNRPSANKRKSRRKETRAHVAGHYDDHKPFTYGVRQDQLTPGDYCEKCSVLWTEHHNSDCKEEQPGV